MLCSLRCRIFGEKKIYSSCSADSLLREKSLASEKKSLKSFVSGPSGMHAEHEILAFRLQDAHDVLSRMIQHVEMLQAVDGEYFVAKSQERFREYLSTGLQV